ncbi:MAG: carboxypeptidase-like regulatory domain-containing protein, partial [candidate division Zixibacteria bacterium]|nr:carboxypeptidase-like regulatory domain-containing protein [candidate division Zixibacteria bacterium]
MKYFFANNSRRVFFLIPAILLLFISKPSFCQQGEFLIKGVVLDEISQDPIPGVTIMDPLSGKGVITNDDGEFNYRFDKFPLLLSINHLGYFTDSLRIEDRDQYKKNIEGKTIVFSLRENLFQMDEVVVSVAAVKLFVREPFAIMDYVIKNNRFIALGYRNYNPLKREIFIGKPPGRILSYSPLPTANEIFQDCQGEIYAVARDSAFIINFNDDTLVLNAVCGSKFFIEQVKPIQSIDNQYFIYREKSKKGQYHDYYICDSKTDKQEVFYRVGARNNEQIVSGLDQRISGEFMWNISKGWISGGELRAMHARLAKAMNKKNTEYRPVHSSMIQLGDTSLLFDFDNKYVNCFELNSNLLWRTQIQTDLSKDFTGRVHHDKISNRYYLEFLNVQLSYLIELDPKSGKELSRIPIKGYKHIDHISVHNNR